MLGNVIVKREANGEAPPAPARGDRIEEPLDWNHLVVTLEVSKLPAERCECQWRHQLNGGIALALADTVVEECHARAATREAQEQ